MTRGTTTIQCQVMDKVEAINAREVEVEEEAAHRRRV
jgi:hypothetical protein